MKKRKNNKKILILSLLLILFLTITATQAAEIQDNTTTTSDSNAIASIEDANTVDTQLSVSENDKVSAGEGTFTELQDYINEQLNSTNVIKLEKDYKWNLSDKAEAIKITQDNITIDGQNHIIDGSGINLGFKITGNNIVITNIIIKNTATTTDNGCALYIQGANATIKNSQFINNDGIRGGAIYLNGENATIKDSQFIKK